MLPPRLIGTVLGWWLVGNILFISAWDIVIIALGYDRATVSYFLYNTLHSRPALWFLVGVGVGHLLAPLVLASNGGHP